MISSKLLSISSAGLILVLTGSATLAADEYNVSKGLTTEGMPLGVHGVDTVTLATGNSSTQGSSFYTATHDGVAYYFASEKSKTKFQSNPEAYLPQFGGFCAYAVALGKKFDGDPRYADVRDGNLYLFVNADVFAAYNEDPDGTLTKAIDTWPTIRHVPVSEL